MLHSLSSYFLIITHSQSGVQLRYFLGLGLGLFLWGSSVQGELILTL